ncbi:hypothetical protein TWF106_001631 [Orbilia oligospora]|uniref:MYND-type domain-containing protein n=1 Tax=Orbilia oligospora TaxID=2813651 RepID=A0A7C8U854_ORBOL|nr:hypothetical protein TWF106_001631 [Orbilia oligospora]
MPTPPHRKISQRACDFCAITESSTTHLLRCSGCQASYYCDKIHQAADRPRHKTGCKAVKKARDTYESEDQKLRNFQGDIMTPSHPFENCIGHFWGVLETRDYMRARYNFVDTIMQVFGATGGRIDVVRSSLEHLLDMLRLCRGDNMGVRDVVPGLYIRLGRDQEAYDFLKWWGTMAKEDTYDWGDTESSYLDVKDADALEEPVEGWKGKWIDLSHAVAVVLIKVRILIDLQAAQNTTRALHGTIPQEIIDLIRDEIGSSGIVGSRPDILRGDTEKLASVVETIKAQIKELYKGINEYCPDFWPMFLGNPQAAANQRPGAYTHGSKEEARLAIGYSIASWIETAGAFDTIKALSQTV